MQEAGELVLVVAAGERIRAEAEVVLSCFVFEELVEVFDVELLRV